MEIQTVVANMGVWGWLSFGVILMILELFIPGTFVVWFGLGAVLTGVFIALFAPLSIAWQILIFVVMSIICVAFGSFVYAKIFGVNKQNAGTLKTGAKRFIGQTFEVCESIKNAKGKVIIGDTVWLASADEDIKKGELVIVEDVNGTVLKVKKK
ncbi:MAG: NfeD family protein [Alphaproteobacteria bacterium]|nr:NfeD family protein [Alphaproteobacteria bacterium]